MRRWVPVVLALTVVLAPAPTRSREEIRAATLAAARAAASPRASARRSAPAARRPARPVRRYAVAWPSLDTVWEVAWPQGATGALTLSWPMASFTATEDVPLDGSPSSPARGDTPAVPGTAGESDDHAAMPQAGDHETPQARDHETLPASDSHQGPPMPEGHAGMPVGAPAAPAPDSSH